MSEVVGFQIEKQQQPRTSWRKKLVRALRKIGRSKKNSSAESETNNTKSKKVAEPEPEPRAERESRKKWWKRRAKRTNKIPPSKTFIKKTPSRVNVSTSSSSDLPPRVSVSIGTQTDPSILEQLSHEGDTMNHRLNTNANNSNRKYSYSRSRPMKGHHDISVGTTSSPKSSEPPKTSKSHLSHKHLHKVSSGSPSSNPSPETGYREASKTSQSHLPSKLSVANTSNSLTKATPTHRHHRSSSTGKSPSSSAEHSMAGQFSGTHQSPSRKDYEYQASSSKLPSDATGGVPTITTTTSHQKTSSQHTPLTKRRSSSVSSGYSSSFIAAASSSNQYKSEKYSSSALLPRHLLSNPLPPLMLDSGNSEEGSDVAGFKESPRARRRKERGDSLIADKRNQKTAGVDPPSPLKRSNSYSSLYRSSVADCLNFNNNNSAQGRKFLHRERSSSVTSKTLFTYGETKNASKTQRSEESGISSSTSIPSIPAHADVSATELPMHMDSISIHSSSSPRSHRVSSQASSSHSHSDSASSDVISHSDAISPLEKPAPNESRLKRFLKFIRKSKKRPYFFGRSSSGSASTSNKSTQLSLDPIEAAYLNNGVVGLSNLGNTCYMNSMLQCLSHTLEMTDIFLCTSSFNSSICTEYQKVLKRIWLPKTSSKKSMIITTPLQSLEKKGCPVLIMHGFKDSIGAVYQQFSGYHQHDSQEFLRHLINSIHSELLYPKNPKANNYVAAEYRGLSDSVQGKAAWEWYQGIDGSPIADIFTGQFKSSLQCATCKSTSLTFDPFWDMALPVANPVTKRDGKLVVPLAHCFSLFTRDEVMDGDNKPICSKCNKPRRSIKKMTIQRFPPVLVLYMKRFHATDHGFRTKINLPIEIPQCMDLTSFASPETVKDYGADKISYELYATSNHIGSLYAGHYTANIKHFASQKWFTCNDSRVFEHTPSSSLLQDPIVSSDAYVLFYRRVIS